MRSILDNDFFVPENKKLAIAKVETPVNKTPVNNRNPTYAKPTEKPEATKSKILPVKIPVSDEVPSCVV